MVVFHKPVTNDVRLARTGGSSPAGDVFYSVLVEWWLTDGEEPLPLPTPAGASTTAAKATALAAAPAAAQPLRCAVRSIDSSA